MTGGADAMLEGGMYEFFLIESFHIVVADKTYFRLIDFHHRTGSSCSRNQEKRSNHYFMYFHHGFFSCGAETVSWQASQDPSLNGE